MNHRCAKAERISSAAQRGGNPDENQKRPKTAGSASPVRTPLREIQDAAARVRTGGSSLSAAQSKPVSPLGSLVSLTSPLPRDVSEVFKDLGIDSRDASMDLDNMDPKSLADMGLDDQSLGILSSVNLDDSTSGEDVKKMAAAAMGAASTPGNSDSTGDSSAIALSGEKQIIELSFAAEKPIGMQFLGNEVRRVREGSAAESAGVRPGWVILSVNGATAPNSTHALSAMFGALKGRDKRVGFDTQYADGSVLTQAAERGAAARAEAKAAAVSPKNGLFGGRKQLLKVIVIGNAKCGKTSVINRFVNGVWDPSYKSTIGCDYHAKDLVRAGTRVRLQLFDIAGQDRFIKLTRAYYRNAAGVVVICDVSRPATLEAVEQWKNELDNSLLGEARDRGLNVPVILIANKIDLLDNSKQTFLFGAKVQALSQKMNFDAWYVGSAKQDCNISEAIGFLVDRMLVERSKQQNREGAGESAQKSQGVDLSKMLSKVGDGAAEMSCCS